MLRRSAPSPIPGRTHAGGTCNLSHIQHVSAHTTRHLGCVRKVRMQFRLTDMVTELHTHLPYTAQMPCSMGTHV